MVQFTFRANGSAVREHDVLGDGQTQARPSRFAGAGLLNAVKTLEQPRHVLGRDAWTEIADAEFDSA